MGSEVSFGLTTVEEMADFVVLSSFADLSDQAVDQLKIRVLDSLACAIGALRSPTTQSVKQAEEDLGGKNVCTLIGGGRISPDRAALINGALVRYLDFNDSFLSKGETCHPSDNVAPVLAAAESADCDGKEFLLSLAVAYQVQCRLSEVAPVRIHGYDHTTQGAYAVAAGVAKALRLDANRTANAIAISGTALNALRVTRTGKLSNWKGLAYPFTSFAAINAVFLAKYGITGPLEVFEGNKGFNDAYSGGGLAIDWKSENFEIVKHTILKKYNSEVHSQSAVECILKLKSEFSLEPKDVESIEVKIFDVAFKIIGGGEEGEKHSVETKEQADHSLPYILAVALCDGEVMPEQYSPERILARDVQGLMQRITIVPDRNFSLKFPEAMPCAITVRTKDGKTLSKEVEDYEGFLTRPMDWRMIVRKFERLTSKVLDTGMQKELEDKVKTLDNRKISDLTNLLQQEARMVTLSGTRKS